MVNRQDIYVMFLMVVLISSGAYITLLNQDLRIRVDEDKTTFYVKNENNRWVVSGREFNKLFDGTSLMNRRLSESEVVTIIDDTSSTVTITRYTKYIRGPVIIDTYYFNGKLNGIESFPVSHTVEIFNGSGFFYRYEVRDLVYDGITEKLSITDMSFGRNMKITWQEGYRWARVFKSGILKVQYNIPTDYEIYNVRLFDPRPVDITENILISPGVFEVRKCDLEYFEDIRYSNYIDITNRTYIFINNITSVNEIRVNSINKLKKQIVSQTTKSRKINCKTIGLITPTLKLSCSERFRCDVIGSEWCYVNLDDGDKNFNYKQADGRGWDGGCIPISDLKEGTIKVSSYRDIYMNTERR